MSFLTQHRIVQGLKILLVVGILGYLVWDVHRSGQWQVLLDSPKQWGWVGLGWLACLAAHLFAFVRWQLMIRALGLPFTLFDSIRIGLIGLFFGLFAFGVVGGDTLRAFYVTRQVRDRTPEAITSVLADRMIGILTMFMIASVAFLGFDSSQLDAGHQAEVAALNVVGWTVVGCTAVGLLGVVLLALAPRLTRTQRYYQLTGLPRLGPLVVRLTAVVGLYRERLGAIGLAFLLSLGVNVCFATSIFSLAAGLADQHPGFSDHFVIEPIAMVSNAIPVPGGIGTMEVAMKYLYLAFGSASGVIIGVAFRFALLSIAAVGGVVWFFNRSQVASLETTPSRDEEPSPAAS